MKKTLLLLFTLFTFSLASAQIMPNAPWMKELNSQFSKSSKIKFQDIVDAANKYWVKHDRDAKGSGYKPFKRWENYWKNYVDENGYLPTNQDLWNTWLQKQDYKNASTNRVDESNWQAIGPFTHTNTGSWSSGQGRVNSIIVDPNNPTTYYVGAPAGGIWKSTDSGATWAILTDHLPQIGVSGIAIDYNDSNTIYIATGDDDAGDSFSVGVWKSTDGGANWSQTGLNPSNSPSRMNDIYINPSDSNMLWVATNGGVFKTTDAGVTWTMTQSGNIRDIKVKPGDPNTIYAVNSEEFYQSTDAGDTFTKLGFGLPSASNRLVIDVTPANAEVVYAVSADGNDAFQGIYKSLNSGVTFAKSAETVNIFESTQSWYDLALAVSDVDENEIYVGCLNVWKSSNSGDVFTKLNNWSSPFTASYTHADIHLLRFYNGEIFAGTDGGIYKSADGGTNFSDLTAGIQISQFYRISVSKQSSQNMVGGLQDNGGFSFSSNQWQVYYGADGMDAAVDPNNDNIHYGFIQFGGNLYISNSAGASMDGSVGAPAAETGSGDSGGRWITPLVMNSDSELYAGYSRLYKLENGAWVPISPAFQDNVYFLEIDDNNPNNIFVSVFNRLFRSTDRGFSFDSVETFPQGITSIEVNNNDSSIIYVTTSGGANGGVFKSIDGGDTFANIAAGLPSVTKNIIKHQEGSIDNVLYLGTSLGVYRFDDTSGIWEVFENNLPNVSVSDLEINIIDDNITASTYGRGVWQSPLATTIPADDDLRLVNIDTPSLNAISCGDVTPQITVKNNGLNTVTSIDLTYTINAGADNNFTWNGNLVADAATTIDLPVISGSGTYSLYVSATIANDAFPSNNDRTTSFYINSEGVSGQVNTFESASDDLITYNEGGGTSMWERGVPTGTQLNTPTSGTSVYGTVLNGNHPDKTKSFLISGCYDLSSVISPTLKFNMAFAIEFDWDLAYVEYSTDQGDSWSLLGSSTDPNWYNSSRIAGDGIANDCFNCVGGQWTGVNTTMTAYSYDLAALAAETSVIFRMVYNADDATNDEGVILDDFFVDGLTSDVDGDGVGDGVDNCPNTPNADQADNDNDGIGDVCDDDDDNDTILDVNDNCPLTANTDQADDNGDGIGNVCDTDNDTILNDDDNCPDTANTDQADDDGDGIGNVCDDDLDNDGIDNGSDNCPNIANADQLDTDGDGAGDVCDTDDDGDGILDASDNCPITANADQADFDGDGVGDVCDDDSDNDGVDNASDNCPDVANANQADNDGDGIGDVCDDDDDDDTILDVNDNCPLTANTDQADNDGDGLGDVCDDDDDNDTILDVNDNCPLTANTDQADFDGDGLGDLCDEDDDGDGVLDVNDDCKLTPLNDVVDTTGCTVFTLPGNNYQLQITSETCRNSNNGSIAITTVTTLDYTAQLTGNGLDVSQAFTSTTDFNNLESGDYMVCFTVDGQAGYEICFNVTIDQPEDLAVLSRISSTGDKISLDLDGGSIYYIDLNGSITSTTESQIELDIIKGINTLKVSTDKDCQGVYNKTFNNFETIKIYPNPIYDNQLTINMANVTLENVDVKLYSMIGKVIISKAFKLQNGAVTIDLPEMSAGIYILDLNDGNTTTNFKIIKK